MFFYDKVIFKQKSLDESAYDLCKQIQTTGNQFEKKILSQMFDGESQSFEECKEFLKREAEDSTAEQLRNIKNFWEDNAKRIVEELQSTLQCQTPITRQILCFLDMSPNMIIDYSNATISLSAYTSFRDNIDFFVAFLIKCAVINRLWEGEAVKINMEYSKDSVYWVMADLVADSICHYSRLQCFKITPAYKFYYAININGENLIDKLREVYLAMPIIDYIKYVLSFVEKNWDIFEQFKNRY